MGGQNAAMRTGAATSAGGNGRTKAPRQSGETLDDTLGQTAPDVRNGMRWLGLGLQEGGAIPNKKADSLERQATYNGGVEMKQPGFQIVERPNKELDVFNADIDQFVEFRERLPYHECYSFVDRGGRIDARLRPLANVVPINGRYLVGAA